MFNWLDYANKKEVIFNRISWLKITGALLLAWDEDNFASIIERFGKVISQYNVIFTCSDISFGKVGIIITHRRKINEEIVGSLNGKSYIIGIVELMMSGTHSNRFHPSNRSNQTEIMMMMMMMMIAMKRKTEFTTHLTRHLKTLKKVRSIKTNQLNRTKDLRWQQFRTMRL
ncbi:unnamed protein product [Lactuca saligna]|uniref:DUF4283 domain-containing protein n=1 Tax=Lactuca saligna TaxID=75948 RepID=A0AA36EFT4_LACSI|nr:unnamed protein product [Lactuca saligna]